MPVYLEFNDDGKQIATIQNDTLETGTGWKKAPKGFDWNKRYVLKNGRVCEESKEDVDASDLECAKEEEQVKVYEILERYRRAYTGYSFEKGKAYEAQLRAAKAVLSDSTDKKAISLIEPLATARNASVTDMTTLIVEKAQLADQALILLEAFEDKAETIINTATNANALRRAIFDWHEDIKQTFNKEEEQEGHE